ncbi:hypothetical protein DXG03_007143 [Asterophora parasitica]|uniref:Uncharacterized protein n=1 Tax=Asterophora parasitica TaxID=117018 RepID=A0A9P7GGC5_9AGAR|nr:hypothetical protein DXG03_007143 [Asterophora parasitica]
MTRARVSAFHVPEDDEEKLERGLDQLQLDEGRLQLQTTDAHVCGDNDMACQQLISRMTECLELERKARRNAEESHLIELQKRLEMERLVEALQKRLAA